MVCPFEVAPKKGLSESGVSFGMNLVEYACFFLPECGCPIGMELTRMEFEPYEPSVLDEASCVAAMNHDSAEPWRPFA
jgi:hypothetical protein